MSVLSVLGADLTAGAHDVVDEAVLEGLLGGEPVVAVGVGDDLLHRVPGVGRRDLRQLLLHLDDEVRVDADIGGRAAGPAGGADPSESPSGFSA